MDESFSPVIFIYGLAIILGVGKACTLLIWRTLPRPRPRLRQGAMEAWHRWTQRMSREKTPDHPRDGPDTPIDLGGDISGRTVSAMTCAVRPPLRLRSRSKAAYLRLLLSNTLGWLVAVPERWSTSRSCPQLKLRRRGLACLGTCALTMRSLMGPAWQ
jgi:hypothetical protein